jgi:hypothetical protein
MQRLLRILLAVVTIVSASVAGLAQVGYPIGTGTNVNGATGYPAPYGNFYDGAKHQMLYTAQELLAAGMPPGQIVALGFDVVATNGMAALPNFTIGLANTTRNPLFPSNNPFYVENVPVVFGPQTYTLASTGWSRHDLTTPVTWDGVSNLVVEVCFVNPGCGTYTRNAGTRFSITTTQQTLYRYNDCFPTICTQPASFVTTARPNVQFWVASGIEFSFPDDVDPRRILRAGSVYDGSDPAFPKPSLSFRQRPGQAIDLTYRIVGPFPSNATIYEARLSGSTTIRHNAASSGVFTYEFTEATGPAARFDGALDLRFTTGGEYRVIASYKLGSYVQNYERNFNIAFDHDLGIRQIRSPQVIPVKYPRNVSLPVSAVLQNIGLNTESDFELVATVSTHPAGDVVYRDTVQAIEAIAPAISQTYDFRNFVPNDVGQYRVTICANLKGAVDQQPSNDCLPRTGNHIFQVLYNEEAGASEILVPKTTGEYYQNRPFSPEGVIVNGGIIDLTDVPVRMNIYKMPARTLVYSNRQIVPDVNAQVPINFARAVFAPFTPAEAGAYQACLVTEYPGDPVTTNNEICLDFNVNTNLSGTYTIGTTKAGDPRNFLTFQAAIDALYLKGVSGPVTFELTDASYSVGDPLQDLPAIDLTTRVLGMSAANTVTFKPSITRSLTRNAITVTLSSGRGVGVSFGQSYLATNANAVRTAFPANNTYANSAGYFTFDGGSQKSIAFNLNATTPHRAVFYLGDGSQNITVRNCIIGNAPAAAPSYATTLPTVSFVNNIFVFQNDVRAIAGQTVTYSAGIVSRAKLPGGRDGNNGERLDTVINSGNKFIGNEISGFGYGVVSLGIGAALKSGVNEYRSYYTAATEVASNSISNVRRAGIFLGYEDGATLRNNRIYSVGAVTGGTSLDAAGIYAGGATRYNNMNLTIDGNEISDISGDVWARGIVVEQDRNVFPAVASAGLSLYFPNAQEKSVIRNNMVWGIKRTSVTANAAGIHLFTERGATILDPSTGNTAYFTRGDNVVNNTIVMPNDEINGSGLLTAIGIQHANAPVVKNNAIVMQGTTTASSFSHAAITWQGVALHEGNDPMALVSDRNAFQLGNASAARLIEITNTSNIITTGAQDEFKLLSQWRAWTGRDRNSIEGDIFAEHVITGLEPMQSVRVRTKPVLVGSILNARGERLTNVTTDIDGQPRGTAGLAYDIGADEFNASQYFNDLEAVEILSPSVYRSVSGPTSDAEYIMTTAPVDVRARIRNNGGVTITNAKVRVRIFMETAASNNAALAEPLFNAFPAVDRTVTTTLAQAAQSDVTFNIPRWTPTVYFALAAYNVPNRFLSMRANVTPRYRIEVSVANDEYNVNNTVSKVVRFYITRSNMRLLVSGRGADVDLFASPTASQIAGKLNLDSLVTGLGKLGWVSDPANGNINYDVFDRTAWEERAVNYAPYRTMFYATDNNRLSRFERMDLRRYIAAGSLQEKKNLGVGSQNYVRQHVGMNVIDDEAFVRSIFRATSQTPGTPVPTTLSYNDRRVRGEALGRNTVETVTRTGFVGDDEPNPALLRTYSDATTIGLVSPAYFYVKGDRATTDSLMGTATASLVSNVVYLGVDWRHWKVTGVRTGLERVLRATVDFFEKNGGIVVPVELASFDAKGRGNDVDVFWTTASEKNADHFAVERANAATAGDVVFETVGTVDAAGNTSASRDYVFRDKNVESGSYLYRLKMVDADGSADHSSEVNVVIGGEASLSINSIAPQPANGPVEIEYSVPTSGRATITIVDVTGRVITTVVDEEVAAGVHAMPFTVATLANGSYTVMLRTDDGSTATMPLVIRR